MTERFRFSLSGMWLFVCLFTLLTPVFLPSVAGSSNPAANVVGTATTAMFILSFPSSLFGLPLLVFLGSSLSVSPNSMEGMYLNLSVMFVLGLVQWFWIAPRIWHGEQNVATFEISTLSEATPIHTFQPAEAFPVYDERKHTPVERVIREENGEV